MISLAMMTVGSIAIGAAAVVGWSGYPPARAQAVIVDSAAQAQALGVESDSTVVLGEEVSPQERMDEAVASAGNATVARFAAPAKKRKAAAPKPRVNRVSRMAAPAKHSSGGRSSRAAGNPGPKGRGWHSARVSWYGPGFYGNTMAGGGKLRRDSMVVAHRSLPFGTRIEFSYKGRTAIAVVRDRGPFIHGRVFDLGPGVAKTLGFGGVGVVKYRFL
jgi:rare lipoprotein A (peptidoglycan hydrolase)